jgi:hypothetical protein
MLAPLNYSNWILWNSLELQHNYIHPQVLHFLVHDQCCRRLEKISWTDHVRNEEVLLRVKEQRNILHEIRERKANWIGHILRRNCLLQHVIEGKIKGMIEVTGRWGRRRRKLLDDVTERRGYSHLKEEALDRTMWRAGFGRGFGPVVRQTTEWMKWMHEWMTNVGVIRESPSYRTIYIYLLPTTGMWDVNLFST